MKLDRNTNPDGQGKYALVQLRKVREIRALHGGELPGDLNSALEVLGHNGRDVLHWGDESPGDQFFVIKYKDKFAAPALLAYHEAVFAEARKVGDTMVSTSAKILAGEKLEEGEAEAMRQTGLRYRSLMQYAEQIHGEYLLALKSGDRVPD